MESRLTRPRFGIAIGIAVLLSVMSPKLTVSDAAETVEPNAPTAAPDAPKPETGVPTKVVDALHENLIDVMKNSETLGYNGRFEQLEPLIGKLFDIPFMAEKSIGRYWKTLDERDQTRLLTTFGRFTVANYAGRFTDYSGQSFETFKEEPSKNGTVLVYSRLDTGNGETVQLNYRLRPDNQNGWRIIDVLLNGTVSELALRRSEYSSLIQREGFAALMTALNQRIDDLAGGKAPENASYLANPSDSHCGDEACSASSGWRILRIRIAATRPVRPHLAGESCGFALRRRGLFGLG